MTITLYSSPGDRNLLNRGMTTIATLTAVQTTDIVDAEAPDLLINYNPSYLAADYFYIPIFGRYYFKSGATVVNGNQIRLILESDPLMSFKSGILNSQCIAKRSTSHINPELEDTLVAFKSVPKRVYRKMSTGFNPTGTGGCYVLTLGGK